MINGMFTVNNKYGYKLNVNHPKIKELYFRFKAWKGIPTQQPLTDAQRLEFESYILPKIKQ